MKTPREILLNRHQAAETRLDPIRREVLAHLRHQQALVREMPLLIAAALKLWRELIFPARVAWTGLAAVWVLIGLFNLAQTDETSPAASASPVTKQDLRAARERRQELMLELALLPAPDPAEPPKPNLQPRSSRHSESACV